MNTENTQNPRPFGYWITAVDRLMAAEFATAFEKEGATRRDWRLLNAVDGTAPARRPLHPGKLHGLVERGWVVQDGEGWALTDEGREAKERLGAVVDGIRAQVADAVSPEDFDTTVATLEQIARTFGWDENTPLPRGRRGRGRGFGRPGGRGRHGFPFGGRHGFGSDFRPGFGPGLRPGFGPDVDPRDAHECGHPHSHAEGHGFGRAHGRPFGREHGPRFASETGHDEAHGFGRPGGEAHGFGPRHGEAHGFGPRHGHSRDRDRRVAQQAFERGFDAGYSRGREA